MKLKKQPFLKKPTKNQLCCLLYETFRERRIKGKQERFGDVSFTLQAFPKISLTYIFWDGDEEFPASANILFDDQIANWTHPESVPVLAETGTRKLIEAAGGERGFWVER